MTEKSAIRVESVNSGIAAPLASGSKLSGIDKQPRTGAVRIDRYGVDGDAIIDTANHGGIEQAVYVYCAADYDWWQGELGMWLPPGRFGENLTLSGLENAEVSVGDRFSHDSGLVLEVTSPRTPCETFEVHMAQRGFIRRFMKANRTGFYCRVLSPGTIAAGDILDRKPFAGRPVTITELIEYEAGRDMTREDAERIRAAPVHAKFRDWLTRKFA